MTPQIALTMAILVLAVFLFVTERLRADLVALLVLVSLVIAGLVTPAEALSGFSNPAVVTVWAVFILSAALAGTGVANEIGRHVLRLSGHSEVRLLIVIILTAGVLSAFMNNVGVAALLLPVVLTIAKQTGLSPSKLLLPLAVGCLLGGLTTLIGTPPNILTSNALRDAGLEPFQLFDFVPVGVTILLAGSVFMVLIGRRLLPDRSPVHALSGHNQEMVDAGTLYDLEERLAILEIPADSPLAGNTLAESRIGRALGLIVLGLQRHGRKQLYVQSETVLEAGDLLLVVGKLERREALGRKPIFIVDDYADEQTRQLFSLETGLAELTIKDDSSFLGKTLSEIGMRREHGIYVLAIRRNELVRRTKLQNLPIMAGDTLLLLGNRSELSAAQLSPSFHSGLNMLLSESEAIERYQLDDRLMVIRIPEESPFIGQSLLESNLGKLFGLVAVGIVRSGHARIAPPAEAKLQAGDVLLVEGKADDLAVIRGLRGLIPRRHLHMEEVELESDAVGLVEAVLAPRTMLVGKSLRDIHFREKYGLSVLAIWREGRAYRSELGDMPLQFGDAFLIYGPKEKFIVLSRESDFLLLAEELQEAPRREKAPVAVIIMAAVVFSVLIGWLPIAIAAVAGAALMVLTGCLHIEEVYRQIEWRAVFLIAGMFPLGIAMENSGTAQFLATGVVAFVEDMGATALLAGLFILTNVASQFMPNAVVAVLMAPIALNTAADLDASPYALMMVIAIAASASFMSPVGHPANGLIMGPGGYRFSDYIKVGIPLTIVVLLVTLLILPLFWPL